MNKRKTRHEFLRRRPRDAATRYGNDLILRIFLLSVILRCMDKVSRTRSSYETDADAYITKYLAVSTAERYGDLFLNALDGPRVLDAGCGPGSDLSTFVSAGYEVTGIDITQPFLRTADTHVPAASLVQGDMRRLPFFDQTFDGVWSSAAYLHIPRADALETLQEFQRVLRSNGVAFLSVKRKILNTNHSDGRYFEYYELDELRPMLRDAGLTLLQAVTTEHWVSVLAKR